MLNDEFNPDLVFGSGLVVMEEELLAAAFLLNGLFDDRAVAGVDVDLASASSKFPRRSDLRK